jgi:hypothetical protein
MKTRYQDKTFLLGAGLKYDLNIQKIIDIPGDQAYYVGVDPNGLKHLVPETYYRHYGIRTGDTVRCRLDRINCLGRFFFEPENPFYQDEGTYVFTLKAFNILPCNNDLTKVTASVMDRFGLEWVSLPFEMRISPPGEISSILCRVKSLKKAKMYLQVADPRII